MEDDGTTSGLSRSLAEAERWVMDVGRNNLQPPIIPYWEVVHLEDRRAVGVITLPADGPDKPYKAKRGQAWLTYVRVGSTSREATREEEARLYQAARLVRYDIMPLPGSGLVDLDRRRLENYFRGIQGYDASGWSDSDAFERLLLNTDILVEERGHRMASAGALLLFGGHPNRCLPHAGITATTWAGTEKSYEMMDEEVIRGPLVSLLSSSGKRVLEAGVIDRAIEFVRRNMGRTVKIEGGRRRQQGAYPLDAVREAVVNAVAHRDYP